MKLACRFDDKTVFYFDAYDNKYVSKGGSLSWRLNNPGLLRTHESFVYKRMIDEDVDYYLDTVDAQIVEIFRAQRKDFYQKEFAKISNSSVLKQSENATFGHWEHSFIAPCYLNKLEEIIQEYKRVAR